MSTREVKRSTRGLGISVFPPTREIYSFEKKNEEFIEKLKIEITDRMNRLMSVSDFLCKECVDDVEYLSDARYKVTDSQKEIVDCLLATLGVMKLFVEIWKKYFKMDFLNNDNWLMKPLMKGILYLLFNCMANSTALCVQVFEGDHHKIALNYLKSDYFDPSKTVHADCEDVVYGLVVILHNMLRKVPESIQSLREQKAFDVFQRYRRSPSNKIACMALILQGYIITEEENELVNSDDSNFTFLKDILVRAMNPNNYRRRADGFAPIEAIFALNRLAVNDNNKTRIVRVGLLPFYVELLQPQCSGDEQEAAAEGLWTLAFKCTHEIANESGCVAAMKKLTKVNSERLKRLAEGVLWTLEISKRSLRGQVSRSGQYGQRHVFISYQWDSQPMIKKLVTSLEKEGFQVWVDFNNMAGSILEAMANAVEEAAVVIVCLSQKYKESPNCRAEGEYTFRLRKDILPLRLQSDYWPDGWLGAMIGNRLMHDFTSDEKYSKSIKNVIRELGERGKTIEYEANVLRTIIPSPPTVLTTTITRRHSHFSKQINEDDEVNVVRKTVPSPRERVLKQIREAQRGNVARKTVPSTREHILTQISEAQKANVLRTTITSPRKDNSTQIREAEKDEPDSNVDKVTKASVPTTGSSRGRSSKYTWASVEIVSWLKDNKLEEFQDWFKDFNGTLLIEYKAMLENAPEAFYSVLKQKFSQIAMLKLSNALKQL